MKFESLSIADLPKVRALLLKDPREQSEYAISYQFPFTHAPRTLARFAETAGCGIWEWRESEHGYRYFFPFGGGDRRKALLDLRDYCQAQGHPLVVTSMSKSDLALFKETLGSDFSISAFREEADYVYNTHDLAELPGRIYQSRRTFVNHFIRTAPWSYEPITPENISDCHRVLDGWEQSKNRDGKALNETQTEESVATRFVLDNLFALGLHGGLLRQAGEPVAFGIAERLTSDMMLLAYEKALPHVSGAFQMGDREFARRCTQGCSFVNRAYDEGCPGLRAAKLLYHPIRMIEKFIARAP